jgi:hypothetical protein
MSEDLKLIREFERKFGFECYNAIKEIFGYYNRRIGELTISRDKWKKKYKELKK